MALSRIDKQIFPFFDSVKNPVSVAGTSDSMHNVGYETLMLEIAGATAITLRVEGCANILKADGTLKNDAECVWSTMGVINMKNFNVAEKAQSNGVFAASIGGMARVRIVIESITGTATITGVAEA